jgi:hypothetical protein
VSASEHSYGLAIERFDYARVGTEWAVLRLLARLGGGCGSPAGAGLIVRPRLGADSPRAALSADSPGAGADSPPYPARACRYERRLVGLAAGDPDHESGELLWRASFAVPLAVVEYQHARFELTADGGVALALPTPGIRIIDVQPLRLASPSRRGHAVPRIGVAGGRQRLAAMATLVVVTTTSTPAVALAAGTTNNPVTATARAHAGSVARVQAAERHAVELAREAAQKAAELAAAKAAAANAAKAARAAKGSNAAKTTNAAKTATTAGSAAVPNPASAQSPASTQNPPAAQRTAGAPQSGTGQKPAAAGTRSSARITLGAAGTAAAGMTTATSEKSGTPVARRAPNATTASTAGARARTATRSSTRKRRRRTVMALTDPMATTAPVKPDKHRRASIRELTHPKVTHIFSAPAAPTTGTTPTTGTPPTTGTTGAPPTTGTTGTTGAPPTTGTTGTTPPTGTTGTTGGAAPTGTTGTGTTPPAPTKTPTTQPTTTPTSQPTPGQLQPTPPTPLLTHRERPSSHPVQPLGGLSSKPPVKLASSDGGAAPAGTVPTWSSTPGFNGPPSWTGSVSTDPNLAGAVSNLSNLLTNGNRPPQFLIPIYMQAGRRYDIPWQVLASINAIESDYGRDLSTSSAGAMGWMQFEPGTWKEWGVAADGHSIPNPYDPRDAIFSAARYLAAAGGGRDITGAVFAYNHAGWYVDEVMARAHAIATHALFERATLSKRGTFSVFFATDLKRKPVIRYRGGLLSHYDRLISAANMVSAANFPYVYGGGHEQPARFAPFDCSGSVSYVMQQAGYKVPTTVSGDIPIWKFPAGPGRVTIFYNPAHTFMRIGNRYFGTSGFARPGGGAGWFSTTKLPASYLAQFREVHVPKLGVNSFAPPRPGTTSS